MKLPMYASAAFEEEVETEGEGEDFAPDSLAILVTITTRRENRRESERK
ncbi:MAG: hypothetical protein O7C59_11805 [Rickettsia endosymbiont of Ixodes persulcatus]|nr:hypothetical protein [Rickettsia endosymbiont of Ixodes persulcatus]